MGYNDDRYRNDLRDADLRRDYLRQDYLRQAYLRDDLRTADADRAQIDWENRRDDAAYQHRAAEARYERGKELAKSGDLASLAGLYGIDYRPALADRESMIERFPALSLANIDLFPLNGVTLGRTTIAELNRLGQRSRYVDDQTGEPFRCYQVGGINFWYQDGDVAESVFLSHGTTIPEKWRKHGFSWVHSFEYYGDLLRSLGFELTVTRQPTTRWFSGRRSFSAELEGRRSGLIGLRIKLDFDFGEGTKPSDIDTLYSIDVAVID